MTTPQDPRQHPLQDDEVALARVLRALPSAEPSSKLDAAILGAAADAIATARAPQSRRRVKAERWLPTWAIGTAAAAVLAIGVGTQLRPPLAPEQDSGAPQAQMAPRPAAQDSLDVELIERKREYPPTYPPPAAEKSNARPGADQPVPVPPPPPAPVVAAPALEPASPPAAFPETATAAEAGAFAPPPQDDAALDTVEVTGSRLQRDEPAATGRLRQSPAELNRVDADRRAQARQLEQLRAAREEASEPGRETAALGATGVAAAATEPAAAPAPASSTRYDEVSSPAEADQATLADAAAEDEGRAKQALPPVTGDTALAPGDWIERIRDRWRRGDSEGALASLALLRRYHPDVSLPADLQALH